MISSGHSASAAPPASSTAICPAMVSGASSMYSSGASVAWKARVSVPATSMGWPTFDVAIAFRMLPWGTATTPSAAVGRIGAAPV